jgi:pimeloyl-ACP methyl ester carboxylesterase
VIATFVVSVLAGAVIACGDSTTLHEPSPEVVATAEAVARTVVIGAPISTTPVSGDEEEEPVMLDARVFGDGETGVILAHMRPADQSSWYPFATELAATGDFTALTFDFRGYGESRGEQNFDRVDTDLQAAYEYMRDTLGIERIFLVGASMGGTASLVIAARNPVEGVVSISSPAQFPPMDALEDVDDIAAPKLFITAKDDVPAYRSQEELWELAHEPKQEQIYEGDAHGTALFDSPEAASMTAQLIAFLSSN